MREACRVLLNRNLGLMIARFRQLYDLVIIDTPPILPVPDALILGRWADGAVLAARCDISRFPDINRALHQLERAEITVLGIVLNGVRTHSYYARYKAIRETRENPRSRERAQSAGFSAQAKT